MVLLLVDSIKLKISEYQIFLGDYISFSWVVTEAVGKVQQRPQDLNPDVNLFEGQS